MKKHAMALALLVFGASATFAQTPKAEPAATESGNVVLENEQVRVIEMRFKPGAKIVLAGNPNRFIYGLTDGALLFSPQGKTGYELSFKAGEALWLPAEFMATENDTGKDVRALVVEIKALGRSSRKRGAPKASKGGSKAK